MDNKSKQLVLSIFGKIILVNIDSARLFSILKKIYGSMEVIDSDLQKSLEYTITENQELDINTITISRAGTNDLITDDIGEFIFFFEKDMTIELQKIRSDLLFIHSAALEYEGMGLLLVAPSGSGKSTTAWAMINSGFSYLSDELAPIDLNSLAIMPYPHALNLKSVPPLFSLPEDALYTSQTIHVSIKEFCNSSVTPLKVIFYLEFNAEISEPEINPISTAEATANLYANSLNILAHNDIDNGLNAAVKVASRVKNYKLVSNKLDKTCRDIKSLMVSIK